MANENKKINELVAEDDDPTAELEVLNVPDFADAAGDDESEAHTDRRADDDDSASTRDKSIPELQSDLNTRTKTIGRLQHDIEQLRAKWLGLEAEISSREEIVSNLTRDVEELNDTVARKDKLLEQRNQKIASLKSEITERDEARELLEQQRTELERQLAEQGASAAGSIAVLEERDHELQEMHSRLDAAAQEISSLMAEIAQREESYGLLETQHAELDQKFAEQHSSNAETVAALEEAERESEEMRLKLESAQNEVTSLRAEIGHRDETYGLLEQKHSELEKQLVENAEALAKAERELQKMSSTLDTTRVQSAAELVRAQETNAAEVREVQAKLSRVEEYADTLRYKLQDLTESQSEWSQERDRLIDTVQEISERNQELSEELGSSGESIDVLRALIEQQKKDHEQEVRTLRFELGEAQNTATQTGELNSQLTSDLIDARGFKQELEIEMRKKEEDAQKRVDKLEKRVDQLTRSAEEFEQKLDTKRTAINVLLGELAKKTEQIESIGEMEEVIQDIDNRMSERFDDSDGNVMPEPDTAHTDSDRERITRVLIGSFGDQELRFPLFKKRLTIGRTNDNDIQLRTSYISRRHAVILTEGDATRVVDWGSKNGVFVNSERIKEHYLSNGDIVSIGNAKFRYEERPKRDA
ncbi:MAG: FHA domain-containing protein [Gammaproteobacteria bacterium]|nr:FHA domain-containing protein [Gammaproteobacteria bacterium]